MSVHKNVGCYLWGGPGTIRMIKQKFFHPEIDEQSLLTCYNEDRLRAAKEIFGITDVWATLSWGFNDATEKEDWEFLQSKLDGFRKVGLRVHAYVQGPNVVAAEFPNANWYCRTPSGGKIPYHRGRKLTCVNSPEFRAFFLDRVKRASALNVDGIFIDNPFMGQLGIPGSRRAFVGCCCEHCEQKFQKEHGAAIPKIVNPDRPLAAQYLSWRANCMMQLLSEASAVARGSGKLFGSNSLDPKFDAKHIFGMDLARLCTIQDYLLFETLSLPNGRNTGNAAVAEVLNTLKPAIPTFVVSYKRGIGHDCAFQQIDFDRVFSEAKTLGYCPCIKASEFVTHKRWHNLQWSEYRTPRLVPIATSTKKRRQGRVMPSMLAFVHRLLPGMLTFYYENRYARMMGGWIERRLISE